MACAYRKLEEVLGGSSWNMRHWEVFMRGKGFGREGKLRFELNILIIYST